jgi:hypothetical protein
VSGLVIEVFVYKSSLKMAAPLSNFTTTITTTTTSTTKKQSFYHQTGHGRSIAQKTCIRRNTP